MIVTRGLGKPRGLISTWGLGRWSTETPIYLWRELVQMTLYIQRLFSTTLEK